ncbi:hypothetical protein CB0940_00647 [Cercospora beticola]|uniref:CsbD-like domain-containing protein n=1 Tax=Cercospora beticola TaxID=122368 RepID=A0A2G5IAH8_CERBT|nr:hypothetical protein CB0940_00647 [Cercospora beticola]PIB01554.1 hypothetical protein CB0940_00647 [Cercospora beticola]WPA96073.1 hypothetical protein RHO25_000679 [Cercospora beticola]CAK1355648.1 unnamed protein product [Cercospora beticola]
MSDQNTSTLQSAYEKVTGAAQSALGSLTGSTADKAQGEQKKDVADARHEASKAGATVAGHSVSASGVTPNDPNRQQGSWNQTIGSGKEFVGGALGLEGLKKEGQQQNEEGKAQEAAGQLNDLGSGVANRVAGTVGGAVAGLTGDREEQARRADQHDEGKTLQRGVESELQKQADAERK